MFMKNGLSVQSQLVVSYNNGTANISPDPHHVDVINVLYKHDKVATIKFVRIEYGLGLKEAKDFCDAINEYCCSTQRS